MTQGNLDAALDVLNDLAAILPKASPRQRRDFVSAIFGAYENLILQVNPPTRRATASSAEAHEYEQHGHRTELEAEAELAVAEKRAFADAEAIEGEE